MLWRTGLAIQVSEPLLRVEDLLLVNVGPVRALVRSTRAHLCSKPDGQKISKPQKSLHAPGMFDHSFDTLEIASLWNQRYSEKGDLFKPCNLAQALFLLLCHFYLNLNTQKFLTSWSTNSDHQLQVTVDSFLPAKLPCERIDRSQSASNSSSSDFFSYVPSPAGFNRQLIFVSSSLIFCLRIPPLILPLDPPKPVLISWSFFGASSTSSRLQICPRQSLRTVLFWSTTPSTL